MSASARPVRAASNTAASSHPAIPATNIACAARWPLMSRAVSNHTTAAIVMKGR